MDALVSGLSQVLPGALVQRLLLVVPFVLGGLGAGRLVRHRRAPERLVAIAVTVWNPWVLEHLEMGQWAILDGYFVLPWVALAARRLRRDPRGGWAPAGAALVAAAVCSPSSGVMAVLVLAVLTVTRRPRTWAVVAGLGLVADLPWLLPTLVARGVSVDAAAGFEAFTARAESAAGLLPSLLSLGGTWKTSVVPAERTSVVVVVLSCLLTVAALAGLRRRGASRQPGEAPRLAVVGLVALLLAALPALPGGGPLLAHLGGAVPGTALLRDSQRYLAPAVLPLLVGLASAADWCRQRSSVASARRAAAAVPALLAAAPVVLLPSLAWGGLGDLRTATYPPAWDQVASRVAADPGVTIVLPWRSLYRGFAFAHGRAVLDPAPRYLPGEVLVDDRLFVSVSGVEVVVPSEDPRVGAVTGALESEDPTVVATRLRALGVHWVLVEDQPGAPGEHPVVPAGATVVAGDGLRLIDVSGNDPTPSGGAAVVSNARTGQVALVISGDVSAVMLFTGGLVYTFRPGNTGASARRRSREVFGRGLSS
jgi:hypothetical protein